MLLWFHLATNNRHSVYSELLYLMRFINFLCVGRYYSIQIVGMQRLGRLVQYALGATKWYITPVSPNASMLTARFL